MTSSIYVLPISLNNAPINADTNILSSDFVVTEDMVKPGGGGIIQIYFSLAFEGSPSTLSIFENSVLKGILNEDNDGSLQSNGLYKFELDAQVGDNLNFQSSLPITTINYLRLHLVQFGD